MRRRLTNRSDDRSIWSLGAALALHSGDDETIDALLSDYIDGSHGPCFSRRVTPNKILELAGWPVWLDRLPSYPDSNKQEGGRRIDGRPRSNSLHLPLVSYVTVVRNNAATLAKAIESVQNQTYPHVEHVILDGASTDGTLEVVKRYADRIDYFT